MGAIVAIKGVTEWGWDTRKASKQPILDLCFICKKPVRIGEWPWHYIIRNPANNHQRHAHYSCIDDIDKLETIYVEVIQNFNKGVFRKYWGSAEAYSDDYLKSSPD
jgi:uncharacterized protein YmfQ (DUF2313 family)